MVAKMTILVLQSTKKLHRFYDSSDRTLLRYGPIVYGTAILFMAVQYITFV